MLFKITKTVPVLIFLSAAILLSGCGRKTAENKSMEEIRKEEGVPVKLQKIQFESFKKTLSFFTQLEGIKEATKGAMVGGRIDRIFYKVGDFVNKDQVVIQFAEDNPGVQFEQARSGFENAEKTYKRMKALLDAGEVSQAAYDGVETAYLVAKRNFEALKQLLGVQAPFSGILLDLKVNEGDNVKNDIPLFKMAQVNRMRAKVWANEEEIGMMKKGMKAYTELNGKRFNGTITDISMAIDPVKRAFYAVVEFDNPGLVLKSGMTAEIDILVYENPKAIVIPRNLIMKDANGMYVFIAQANTAAKRYISNGRDEGINYEITNGLNPGEQLIIQGNAQLNQGSKIKIIQ